MQVEAFLVYGIPVGVALLFAAPIVSATKAHFRLRAWDLLFAIMPFSIWANMPLLVHRNKSFENICVEGLLLVGLVPLAALCSVLLARRIPAMASRLIAGVVLFAIPVLLFLQVPFMPE